MPDWLNWLNLLALVIVIVVSTIGAWQAQRLQAQRRPGSGPLLAGFIILLVSYLLRPGLAAYLSGQSVAGQVDAMNLWVLILELHTWGFLLGFVLIVYGIAKLAQD